MDEGKSTFTCAFCAEVFENHQDLIDHLEIRHYALHCQRFAEIFGEEIRKCGHDGCNVRSPTTEQAFGGLFQKFYKFFENDEGFRNLLQDPMRLLFTSLPAITYLIETYLESHGPCKIQVCLGVRFERDEKVIEAGFWSFNESVLNKTDIADVEARAVEKIEKSIQAYTEKGSGWVVHEVYALLIKIGKYNPFQAS